MYPQKHYADCGIQTELSSVHQSLSFYDSEPKIFQSPVGHSCVVTGSDVPSSGSDITLANGSLVSESAYNQSPDWQDYDSPSSLTSRYCVDRTTGILYSRPSEPRLLSKRVLSLTSVSPTGKFKATILGDKLRLVSMPERGKYASVSAKDSLLQKRCIDDLDETSNHEQPERPYPADLPQTPSPPSSPESLTIIGNKAHVPGSFLRRPGFTDNDGWVSWANSPPRPIPALHGPSSLPYARCPSGAEGTLVEGDDLSHKIWGLGIDDSQMAHPPTTNRQSVRQTSQPQDYRPSQAPPTAAMNQNEFALSHYYERDAVIDLSRPATFHGHVGTQRVLSKQNVEHIVPSSPIPTSRQTRMPQLADVENFATLRAKNLDFEEVHKPRQSSTLAVGLGLHTWSARGSRLENVNPMDEISSNPLNTAAPVFVPASANINAYPSKQRYAPQSQKPLLYSLPPRRPSVFNKAAEQYRQADAQSLLPTPPSTSSPCWTPMFSHQPEMAISKSMILTLDPKVSRTGSYSPNIYSPISDLEDDASHIRVIMQQNSIKETENIYDSKVVTPTLSFKRDPFTFQAISLHDPFMAFSTNHDKSPHDRKILQTEPFQAVCTRGFTERRRNLSYQQPRSIPLARLIQRRLSSVAEEDLSTKISFPFLQERQTGGFIHSKGLSLEPLGHQMPRIGLLDEEIFTTEMFSTNRMSLSNCLKKLADCVMTSTATDRRQFRAMTRKQGKGSSTLDPPTPTQAKGIR
ncbi:hypothetical protein BYT27DRAFT_6356873 [Phlegmacium glaucopus]|nr:hypothetical protein BYT27DRAFT_6356873 [Phlegmacium glaucopus]